MIQQTIAQLSELYAQWMSAYKSGLDLEEIDRVIQETWDTFHIELEEESRKIPEDETLTVKDYARSARFRSRKPVIGNKSSGGREMKGGKNKRKCRSVRGFSGEEKEYDVQPVEMKKRRKEKKNKSRRDRIDNNN